MQAVATIMRGEGFSYTMPARTSSNMVYVAELDRLVLRDKMLRFSAADDMDVVMASKAAAASHAMRRSDAQPRS